MPPGFGAVNDALKILLGWNSEKEEKDQREEQERILKEDEDEKHTPNKKKPDKVRTTTGDALRARPAESSRTESNRQALSARSETDLADSGGRPDPRKDAHPLKPKEGTHRKGGRLEPKRAPAPKDAEGEEYLQEAATLTSDDAVNDAEAPTPHEEQLSEPDGDRGEAIHISVRPSLSARPQVSGRSAVSARSAASARSEASTSVTRFREADWAVQQPAEASYYDDDDHGHLSHEASTASLLSIVSYKTSPRLPGEVNAPDEAGPPAVKKDEKNPRTDPKVDRESIVSKDGKIDHQKVVAQLIETYGKKRESKTESTREASREASRSHSSLQDSESESAVDVSSVQEWKDWIKKAHGHTPLRSDRRQDIENVLSENFREFQFGLEFFDVFELFAQLQIELNELIRLEKKFVQARHASEFDPLTRPEKVIERDSGFLVERFKILRAIETYSAMILVKVRQRKEFILSERADKLEKVLKAVSNISATHPQEAKAMVSQLNKYRIANTAPREGEQKPPSPSLQVMINEDGIPVRGGAKGRLIKGQLRPLSGGTGFTKVPTAVEPILVHGVQLNPPTSHEAPEQKGT